MSPGVRKKRTFPKNTLSGSHERPSVLLLGASSLGTEKIHTMHNHGDLRPVELYDPKNMS